MQENKGITSIPMNIKRLLHLDNHMREVLAGASYSLIFQIIGTTLGFIVSIVIARIVGTTGSGAYYLSLSLAAIASTFSRIGLDNSIVRYISSYAYQKNWETILEIYLVAVKIVAGLSIIIALTIASLSEFIAVNIFHNPHLEIPILLSSISIVPLSLSAVHSEALRAIKKISFSQLINSTLVPAIMLILIYPFIVSWASAGAVACYGASTLVMLVISVVLWRVSHNAKKESSEKKDHLEMLDRKDLQLRISKTAWPLYGIAITSIIIQHLATLLLGVWGTVEEVGIFTVANRLCGLMLFPLIAMVTILAPKFSEMHHMNKIEELAMLSRKSARLLTIMIIPISLFMGIMAELVLSLFGQEFEQGGWILRILLVGVVINTSTGGVSELLVMSGNEADCRNINIIGALMLALLCYWLIPLYGGIGAAASVAVSVSVKNILMMIMVKKRLDFLPIMSLCKQVKE